jgi:hypothetical protein
LIVKNNMEIAFPVFHTIPNEGLGLLPEDEQHAREFRTEFPGAKQVNQAPDAPSKPAKP